MKLRELSDVIGVDQMNISSFLYSRRTMPYGKLEMACNALGIGIMSCGKFFSGKDFIRNAFLFLLEQDGMSIMRISKETGINISSLYSYKSGKKTLSNRNIETIMNHYGLELKNEEEL